MTAWCAILQCWAAMAAFRAAVPARLRDETGWDPGDADIPDHIWRPTCRLAGTLLLVVTVAISVYRQGAFEGLMLSAAAAMFASVSVILLAPLARWVVWTLATVALVSSPVLVAATLLWGGGHGG